MKQVTNILKMTDTFRLIQQERLSDERRGRGKESLLSYLNWLESVL
jgi:hypothetical protein